MNNIGVISLIDLSIIAIPLIFIIIIFFKWSLDYKKFIHATIRMIIQLISIGYFLNYIFLNDNYIITTSIILFMIIIASWISLREVKTLKYKLFPKVILSIFISMIITLIISIIFVLKVDKWFEPKTLIPLTGIILANSMNTVSLAVDRFISEVSKGEEYKKARKIALRTALIPITNSFFAVGLVSIPGMMTGQILSGISPLIAVRYQILIMFMAFNTGSLATIIFLTLIKNINFNK